MGKHPLLGRIAVLGVVLLLGALGGAIVGFPIVLFGDYIGRSGSTGEDYWGYWAPSHAWWLARTYGALLGSTLLVFVYVRYFQHLRQSSVHVARQLSLAAGVTLAAGLMGAVLLMGMGAITGSVAFILFCRRTAQRQLRQGSDEHV